MHESFPSESDRAERAHARGARVGEIMAGNPDGDVPVTRTDDVLRRFGALHTHSDTEFNMAAAIAAYDNRVRDLETDAKRWRAMRQTLVGADFHWSADPDDDEDEGIAVVAFAMMPGLRVGRDADKYADDLCAYIAAREAEATSALTPAESRALARAADDDVAADDQRRERAS